MKNCAYKMICKGVCDSSSCLKNRKSEDEYWKEIQEAMVAVGRLGSIRNYLSIKNEIIRVDIIKRWATLDNIHYKSNSNKKPKKSKKRSTRPTCDKGMND
jgi:hypothetical protein